MTVYEVYIWRYGTKTNPQNNTFNLSTLKDYPNVG